MKMISVILLSIQLCTERESFIDRLTDWLHWVFVAVHELSVVQQARAPLWLRCSGFSLQQLLLLWIRGSRALGLSNCGSLVLEHQGSIVVVYGPSCSTAGRIFLDQGLNLCPLHLQGDFLPLVHQGSLRPVNLDGFFWQQTTQNYPSVLKTMNFFLTHIYCSCQQSRDNCKFTSSMGYTVTPHFTYCRMVKIRRKLKCAKLS